MWTAPARQNGALAGFLVTRIAFLVMVCEGNRRRQGLWVEHAECHGGTVTTRGKSIVLTATWSFSPGQVEREGAVSGAKIAEDQGESCL